MSGGGKSKSESTTERNALNTSGLYGNFTGTTYEPDEFDTQIMGMANQYLPQSIENYLNPTYDTIQPRMNSLQSLSTPFVQSNITSPLTELGLSRGNTISDTMADKYGDMSYTLMADNDARQQQLIANALGLYQTPLSTLTGLTGAAGTTSTNTQSTGGNMSGLGALTGAGIGFWAGGPAGASLGASLGGTTGSMF